VEKLTDHTFGTFGNVDAGTVDHSDCRSGRRDASNVGVVDLLSLNGPHDDVAHFRPNRHTVVPNSQLNSDVAANARGVTRELDVLVRFRRCGIDTARRCCSNCKATFSCENLNCCVKL